MKKVIFSLFTASLLVTTSTFLTSCQSPAQKVDNAENKVADAKENVAEAQNKVVDAKENLTEAQKTANMEAQKVANAEAWKTYKAESQATIKTNEARISELRVQMKKMGKSLDATVKENVDMLEKKNTAMKNRIADYDKSQSDWEAFKREYSRDMNELGQALRDFTINNKK